MRKFLFPGLGLGLFAFVLSFALNASIQRIIEGIPLYFGLPLFLFVVAVGILTDALGLACTRASEKALLSMASRKIKGAKESVWFVRNASRMSSVFNDVMGDVSATLSGALAVAIVYKLKGAFPGVSALFLTSASVACASFLTIGGKAVVKPLALKQSNSIVLILGKIRRFFLGFGREG